MQSRCPTKHIKIISISSFQSRFTTSAQFQFPSYVQFYTFCWVVVQFSHTHTKITFSHFKSHVGTIRRLLITEGPVGHFRRLIYSTPNREGPDTLVAQLSVSHLLNRLKTKSKPCRNTSTNQ